MPPATAERLKQRSGVRVAIGLSLQKPDVGLLVGLFGAQQRQAARITIFFLTLRQIERHPGCVVGDGGGFQRLCVLLQRDERVCDILKRDEHCAAILLCRLIISGSRAALLMQQLAAIENGLRQRRTDAP